MSGEDVFDEKVIDIHGNNKKLSLEFLKKSEKFLEFFQQEVGENLKKAFLPNYGQEAVINLDKLFKIKTDDTGKVVEFMNLATVIVPTFKNKADSVDVTGEALAFANAFRQKVEKMREMIKADFSSSFFTMMTLIMNHLFYQFKALEDGFSCDEWKDYCRSFSKSCSLPMESNRSPPVTDEFNTSSFNNNPPSRSFSSAPDVSLEERKLCYIFSCDFLFNLIKVINPKVGGDYFHLHHCHSYPYIEFWDGIGNASNQTVERNHYFQSKFLQSKTSHGSIKSSNGTSITEEDVSTIANRQTEQTLLSLFVTTELHQIQTIAQIQKFYKARKKKIVLLRVLGT